MAPTSLSFCALVAFVLAAGTASATLASTGTGQQYRVGGPEGWRVPTPEEREMYRVWASNITFFVNDSVEFVYKNDSVVRVDKVGYYHCNETAIGETPKDGSTVFRLDKPGFAYFTSGDLDHCRRGQRLLVSVEPLPSPPPGSAMSGPGPAPHPSAAPALAGLLPSARVLLAIAFCLRSLV